MQMSEQARKHQIEAKRNEQDIKVYQTMDEKKNVLTIKKEQKNLERMDRVRTVERI
jgi:hypothetical protein